MQTLRGNVAAAERNRSASRVIERVWEWRFAALPELLWPLLADRGLPSRSRCGASRALA